jgi:hypothetical protein
MASLARHSGFGPRGSSDLGCTLGGDGVKRLPLPMVTCGRHAALAPSPPAKHRIMRCRRHDSVPRTHRLWTPLGGSRRDSGGALTLTARGDTAYTRVMRCRGEQMLPRLARGSSPNGPDYRPTPARQRYTPAPPKPTLNARPEATNSELTPGASERVPDRFAFWILRAGGRALGRRRVEGPDRTPGCYRRSCFSRNSYAV